MKFRPKFNRTKIIATIGPSTASYAKLKEIIKEGVDVCRLNFSHGTYEDHESAITNIRKINEELNSNIAILLDLQGPKLRIGEVENNSIVLEAGKEITITTQECVGTAKKLYIKYEMLTKDIKKGHKILLDDGKVELKVLDIINRKEVKAKIIHGGILSSKKGFNLPQTNLSIPSITKKDVADIEFGLKHNVEWIGLSFVRKAEEIHELKNIIARQEKRTKIVAKIEKPEAVKNIDSIIAITDAIMVARGDLGVEVPLEEVPLIQKDIVRKCIRASKPVIIATQMMESMIHSATPTRAETNDVANAVLDGADAVMLSAETSVGDYPVEAIKTMERIVRHIEAQDDLIYNKGEGPEDIGQRTYPTDVICFTAARMSLHVKNAKAISSMTRSGYTAFKLASYRPKANIFIFTNNQPLLNTLSLVWGVRGFFYDKFVTTDETIHDVNEILKAKGYVKTGDIVVNTASMPIQEKSMTNAVKISKVE
jgi:pyruvate kinase